MKLHTQVFGEGKKLVILHGFLGMGDNWKSLSKNFAKAGFEVHIPDMRNHGKSPHSDEFSYEIMVQDIKEYFDAHGIENAILIGHSMGGKIAMHFAAKYPGLLSHLIVVDISPRYYEPHHDDILDSLKKLRDQQLSSRQEAEEILKTKIEDKGVRLFLLKNLKRDDNNTLLLKPNLDAFLNNKKNIGQALPENLIFKKPTLFMKGEHSNYIAQKDKNLIQQHFPYYKLLTIQNAGHWLHAENPKMFMSETLDFVNA